MINKDLLPVPLKYTWPIIMICYMYSNNSEKRKLERRYYIPESGAWVNRKQRVIEFLKRRNINFINWQCRWFLHLSEELIGTELWANKIIETFYSDKLPKTKKYIKDQLLIDNTFECKFLIVKEDFISEYKRTRIGKGVKLLNYDFSKLPDLITSSSQLLNIPLLNSDNSTKRDYYTNYGHFISECRDASVNSVQNHKISKEIFVEKAIKVHGDKYNYDEVIYIDGNTKVKIYCKKCNSCFYQSPTIHLSGHGCPSCGNEKLTKYSWENEISNIKQLILDGKTYEDIGEIYHISGHQIGLVSKKFDLDKLELLRNIEKERLETLLKNVDYDVYRVAEIDNVTIQAIYYKINKYKIFIDPKVSAMSLGEKRVMEFLDQNNIVYETHKKVYGIEGRNSNYIFVDFMINYNNQMLIIEYNGLQHYQWVTHFHKTKEDFEKQKKRDNNVRNYFGSSLIEIPYTILSYSDIEDFLHKTIIEHINPHTLVDYDKLYK